MTCSRSSSTRSRPRRNSVLRVALTGGIACGKSVVSRLLAEKGCAVFSADREAHALMAPGRAAWRAVAARFGPAVLRPDGTIDRARLGALVFSRPADRRFLDRLIHPLVLAEQEKAARRLARQGGRRILVVEAALIFEAGVAGRFDRVVVVDCPKAEQVRRLMSRDGLSRAAALRRIGTQMPAREKKKRADYVIDASGDLAATVDRTERVYAQLVRDLEGK